MEWQLAEQTIDNNSHVVADQQVLDNAQTLSGKGTVAVHGVSSRLSHNQQQILLANCLILIPESPATSSRIRSSTSGI